MRFSEIDTDQQLAWLLYIASGTKWSYTFSDEDKHRGCIKVLRIRREASEFPIDKIEFKNPNRLYAYEPGKPNILFLKCVVERPFSDRPKPPHNNKVAAREMDL